MYNYTYLSMCEGRSCNLGFFLNVSVLIGMAEHTSYFHVDARKLEVELREIGKFET